MQKIYSISSIFLLLMFAVLAANAQVADSIASRPDTVVMIKQLVKEQLLQQLQQSASYKRIQQNTLTALLKDSSAIDTLSKLVLQQIRQIKNTTINTGKTIVTGAAGTTKQLLQQQFASVLQTTQMNNLFAQFTGILQQPVLKWQGGSVAIFGQMAPSLFNNGTVFINNNTLSGNWAIMGIPMGMQLARQDFSDPAHHSRNVFSFQFNREDYLNSLRDKIKLKIKPADLLPDYNDALQKIKEDALGRLTASLDSINYAYKGILAAQVGQLGDPQNLLRGDLATLQDKLLSAAFFQDMDNKKNQLAQLQQQLNTGGKPDMLLYDSLLQSVQAVKGVLEIISRIKLFKEEAQKNGLLQKLQQADNFKVNQVQQWLQDPDKLKTLAKDQLDLNGLQKFFLNMNSLQTGMSTISLSPLTLHQYTNNGINATFINNKTFLFIMAGRQKEFSSLYDNRFTGSSLFASGNTAMGVRAGRGDLQNSYAHFSLFSYKQGKSSYDNNLPAVAPGKTVVITFSNQLKMSATNYLDLEISTSTHLYDNEKKMADTLLQGSRLSKQLLAGNHFMQQLAFTLQWHGEVKDRDLSYDIHGTRIGKGYSNPGSLFLSGGMTAFGGSFKKNFFRRRLQFSARADYRAFEYSTSDSKWGNYNFYFQGKWKLKKGQYISLRYQPYQSLKWQDDKKITVGGSSRLSLDGSIRRRFGKMNYQHVISLAALRNNYSFDTMAVNNNSILLSSMQTVSINKKTYYLNLQYNKATEPPALAVFNTQLNADAGIAYHLGKNVMASAALHYNSVKDWVTQMGIRQGFSGQIGEKYTISFYADMLKNITAYRPNNMDKLRLDWSLQYLLK